MTIHTIPLTFSNAYLIDGEKWVLVDTGIQRDYAKLAIFFADDMDQNNQSIRNVIGLDTNHFSWNMSNLFRSKACFNALAIGAFKRNIIFSMEQFRIYLERFTPLTPAQWAIIEGKCKEVTLKRGEYFLREGQINRRIGFITEGVCRYTHTSDEGVEITRYFVREGQFVSALDSFLGQIPSDCNAQAVTNARFVTLSFDGYNQLFEEIPNWAKTIQRVTQFAMNEKLQSLAPMIQQDARVRYEHFLRHQSDVLQRVPLSYVASYLGITQQSLSRLRRELAFS
jgi:CRP/FNR family transcriptional regulator, anaerobic regulatory protein